jgi:hypothetical protein
MSDGERVVCAWCTVPSPAVGSDERLGICVQCALGFLKRLPRAYLESIAEPDGTVTLFSGHRLDIATGEAR